MGRKARQGKRFPRGRARAAGLGSIFSASADAHQLAACVAHRVRSSCPWYGKLITTVKGTSTISSKGRITIPRAVRDELDLHAGDRLTWTLRENGSIEVRKESARPLETIVGLLGRPARSAAVEEMDRAVRDRFTVRHRAPRR